MQNVRNKSYTFGYCLLSVAAPGLGGEPAAATGMTAVTSTTGIISARRNHDEAPQRVRELPTERDFRDKV